MLLKTLRYSFVGRKIAFHTSFGIGGELILPFYFKRGILRRYKNALPIITEENSTGIWKRNCAPALTVQISQATPHTCRDTLSGWPPLGWLPLCPDCTSNTAELPAPHPHDNPLSLARGREEPWNGHQLSTVYLAGAISEWNAIAAEAAFPRI